MIAASLLGSCTSLRIDVPEYRVPVGPPSGRLVIGTGRADITPPPGIPMGGHSIAGAVGRGHWMRLQARAFYFEDATGKVVILVSCDLFAIPAGLKAKVAQEVAKAGVPVSPEALVLAATHTHHGPGNYLSSRLYNGFSSPWPGFHRPLFDFLVQRISRGVLDAHRNAKQNAGATHRLALHVGAAPGLARIRSVDAFLRNTSDVVLTDPPQDCGACDRACVRYSGVDTTLTVLELLRGVGAERIGLLVFGAVHPTALTHDNPLYNADLTGWAMTALERGNARTTPGLVAGFFNGAEGDVSPQWIGQDRSDVARLGDLLADSVETALRLPTAGVSGDETRVEAIGSAFRVNPLGPEAVDLADRPLFGVAAIGGAEDGRTFLYHYGWHGGVRRRPTGDHGAKVPALDLPSIPLLGSLKLTRGLSPASAYPRDLPLALIRLKPLLSVGTVPVEMTTTMGRRVRNSLSGIEAPNRFLLVGLANEYLSYVTTPEEYEAQDYEGASTIFGPNEGPVIQHLLERVSRLATSPASREVPAASFDAGPKPLYSFGLALEGAPRHALEEGLESVMPDAQGRPDCRVRRFRWEEPSADDFAATARRVEILVRTPQGWGPQQGRMGPEDDQGVSILTVLEMPGPPRSWMSFWLPPDEVSRSAEYCFRVEPVGQPAVCSVPFRIDGAPGPPVPILSGSCP